MFTVYIDDSGTDPTQAVAIASAVIVPAKRIPAFDNEWGNLAAKENFTHFHTSECVARNPKSEFANWDDTKVSRVTDRIRQITRKYGVKAFSFAVNKADYDHVVPEELKDVGGRFHYTWAIRHIVTALDTWASTRRMHLPFEYVFDWMDKSQREAKQEIETVMEQAESVNLSHPGRYSNYSFRKRQSIPALQCTDMVAWSCYQFALHAFNGTPLKAVAADNFAIFEKAGLADPLEWLTAVTIKRDALSDWAQRELNDPRGIQRRKEWMLSHPK